MSASGRTLHTDFSIVRSSLGDTVTLECSYSCKISKSTREIRWYKGTKCVHQEPFNCTMSLTLNDVKVTDSGQYRCEAHGKRIKDVAVIYLHVAGFKLVPSFKRFSLSNHFPGDDVTLPCHISPKRSAVSMEIRWFKGTDCICVYQNGQVRNGKGYEGRVSLFTHELEEGNVSLMLRNVQQLDNGTYNCKVTDGKDKVESDLNTLRVKEFKLITESYNYYARPGEQVTLPCNFSAEVSAVAMKIRWFKGTDSICVYNNGQLNEGKDYEGRVSLFTQELKEGNVSLKLRNLQESDDGEYKCEVTHQERKLENHGVYLHVTELKLITETHSTTKSSVAQPCIFYSPAGDEVILPCKLSAKVSAVAMEIRWFKGTNCIFVYQNGQVRVCKGYEGRMSLFTGELKDGNVSVGLKNFQESDVGEYKCVVTRIHEVTHKDHKMESSGVYLYMSEFSLVHMPEDVGRFSRYSIIRVDFGQDVTLPCYLNPKQSAVAMEIRWFIDVFCGNKRKSMCICEYQNGEVKEGEGYEGRVSLFTDKLEEGNVSLMLKNYQEPVLSRQCICEVTCGNEKERFIHHVNLRLRGGGSPYIRGSSDDEDEPETRTRKLSDPRDLRPIKPGRRWSNPLDFPNM